jgi:hypothetical protein
MSFFNKAKSNFMGGLRNTVDRNNDGKRGFGEWARFGLQSFANPTLALGRVAYNANQNRQSFSNPYERQQFQMSQQQPVSGGVQDLQQNIQPFNPNLSGYAQQAPQQGNYGSPDVPRQGFNFMGLPAMNRSDANGLNMKSEAANMVGNSGYRTMGGQSIDERFNPMGRHDAFVRSMDMAKYMGDINPNNSYAYDRDNQADMRELMLKNR